MLIEQLPEITFLDPERRPVTLRLAECGGRVRAMSRVVRERFPDREIVGIVHQSSPDLVLSWLAVLDAGKIPLILHYPTRKLSREYWLDSVRHTLSIVGTDAVLARPLLVRGPLQFAADTHPIQVPQAVPGDTCTEVDGTVLQLSSGTTGHKKAVTFTLDTYRRHILDYNRVLQLGPHDRVVSWLPLYHDMGFVACFVMPLMLGVPITMMDAVAWVSKNEMLFEAIETYRGTTCFMPNFGFEVMSRVAPGHDLSSMRHFISCSEPTYRETIERFCTAHSVPPGRVSTCYAMAENVFAIAQSRGLRTTVREGRSVVCCGRPIDSVDVKLVDGEIWVRSHTSITSYHDRLGPIHVADTDGFYPTGDVGFVHEGELYVDGRKNDVMIQGGRKFLLNDLDFTVNSVLPDCRGRAACVALDDARIGTQSLQVVIEREDVTDIDAYRAIQAALAPRLPVEGFGLSLVPPEFITKTSSGKISRRRTAEDLVRAAEWMAARRSDALGGAGGDIAQDVATHFKGLPLDVPIASILDSLGRLVIELIAHDHGVDVDPGMTLGTIIERGRRKMAAMAGSGQGDVLYVVSLADFEQFQDLRATDLDRLADAVGAPVRFESVCMPPVEIVHHDMLFADWFLCRDIGPKYSSYLDCLERIRRASVVLFDDRQEYWFPSRYQSYPVMSRRLQRNPVADLLCTRTARYFAGHHELPVERLVQGPDLVFRAKEPTFGQLQRMLEVPFFRIATCAEFADRTRGWELVDPREVRDGNDPGGTAFLGREAFLHRFATYLRAHRGEFRFATGPRENVLLRGDDSHMCSATMNPYYLERIAQRFDRFLLQGTEASVPWLRRRLTQLGKPFTLVSPDDITCGLAEHDESEFDCIVQCGSRGTPKTSLPILSLQSADPNRGLLVNAPADHGLTMPPYMHPGEAGMALEELREAGLAPA